MVSHTTRSLHSSLLEKETPVRIEQSRYGHFGGEFCEIMVPFFFFRYSSIVNFFSCLATLNQVMVHVSNEKCED